MNEKESQAPEDVASSTSADASSTAVDASELSWSVNPWRANWRRPAAAIALCIAVALLAGFSFTYPNYDTTSPPGVSVGEEQPVPESVAPNADSSAVWIPSMMAWAAVSLLLLLSMTAVIYLPVRYRLDAEGVAVSFLGAPTFRGWEHYRNYYVHKTGVHLTTMTRPSGLDPFRGHFLQYAGNRDAVVAYIEAHVKRHD